MTVGIEETRLSSKDRIAALRERVHSIILHQVYIERARLVTESFKETESEPLIIRTAKALDHVLSNMNIGITDGELIVGDYIEAPGESGCPVLIEYGCDWLGEEVDELPKREQDKAFMTDEDKATLYELLPYWRGKTLNDKLLPLMPDDLRAKCFEYNEVSNSQAVFKNMVGLGHDVVDYETLLGQGMEAVIKDAQQRLEKADLTNPDDLPKTHFYRAAIITNKAVINFASRYAKLARELEEKEPNRQRKEELKRIAEICERVPAKPARDFYEALQFLWLVHIALQIEGFAIGIGPGRVDQYLYPYYKKDIEEGRLDREKAKELILCFFIKLNTFKILLSGASGGYYAGWGTWQNVMVGGVDREGNDATNDLSFLLIEADGELKMRQPETVVRIHKGTPRAFLVKALEIARNCRGKFKFVGDDSAINKLLGQGFTVEEARDYCVTGCAEISVAGRASLIPLAYLNSLKCLELALNNGVCVHSGKQLGPQTGDAAKFKSIQDVIDAFLAQTRFFSEHAARYASVASEAYARFAPTPLQSSLMQGCLESGKDITCGGAMHSTMYLFSPGAINVGDSLAAIKKCVFDEGKITMAELLDTLHKNFEGKEEIQQMLLEAPKFGNDDDYVDLLTRDVISAFCDQWQDLQFYGGKVPAVLILGGGGPEVVTMGVPVSATADGRKSGEPLADGGVSPAVGRNVKGAIATFNSVAKLNHPKIKGGEVLNMRFSPDTLKSDRAMQKFADMVQTYFNMGCYHAQFNIVSTDMLKDAQKNPNKYLDLLVRVATYSAYFVELRTDVQNEIISRMEMELGA